MWKLVVHFRQTGDHVICYDTKQKAEQALERALRRAAFTGLQMEIVDV